MLCFRLLRLESSYGFVNTHVFALFGAEDWVVILITFDPIIMLCCLACTFSSGRQRTRLRWIITFLHLSRMIVISIPNRRSIIIRNILQIVMFLILLVLSLLESCLILGLTLISLHYRVITTLILCTSNSSATSWSLQICKCAHFYLLVFIFDWCNVFVKYFTSATLIKFRIIEFLFLDFFLF